MGILLFFILAFQIISRLILPPLLMKYNEKYPLWIAGITAEKIGQSVNREH